MRSTLVILIAVIAGETMTGFNGTTVAAISHARVREILRKHGY